MTELTNDAVAKALGLVPDENGQWFTADGEWFPGTTDDWRSNEPTPDWLHDIAACQRDVWPVLRNKGYIIRIGMTDTSVFQPGKGGPIWRDPFTCVACCDALLELTK